MSDLYKINVLETAKSKIPLRGSMKSGIIPRFPSTIMISGKSGSGKTNLMLSLLTRKEFYGSYFHQTLIFSPTAGEMDDTYNVLDIPKDNFRKDFTPTDLDDIIESRRELIKKKGIEWVAKNNRLLIIMDDIIADRSFLMSSQALKTFAMMRHFLVQIFVLTQSYNKIPRALRLNVNALMVFPASRSELNVLLDEITPDTHAKKEFEGLIRDATSEQYSFLYINYHAKKGTQIRKNINDKILG